MIPAFNDSMHAWSVGFLGREIERVMYLIKCAKGRQAAALQQRGNFRRAWCEYEHWKAG